MISTSMRFEPTNLSFSCTQNLETSEINAYLAESRFEEAKQAICNNHKACSVQVQECFLQIVKKIAALNRKPLSVEHQDLNYTLEAAHNLASHMHDLSKFAQEDKIKDLSAQALRAVSEVSKKNNHLKDIETAEEDATVKNICDRLRDWARYIDYECPLDQKERQYKLYCRQVKKYEEMAENSSPNLVTSDPHQPIHTLLKFG